MSIGEEGVFKLNPSDFMLKRKIGKFYSRKMYFKLDLLWQISLRESNRILFPI
jgi:hypothetical protein